MCSFQLNIAWACPWKSTLMTNDLRISDMLARPRAFCSRNSISSFSPDWWFGLRNTSQYECNFWVWMIWSSWLLSYYALVLHQCVVCVLLQTCFGVACSQHGAHGIFTRFGSGDGLRRFGVNVPLKGSQSTCWHSVRFVPAMLDTQVEKTMCVIFGWLLLSVSFKFELARNICSSN